MILVFRNLINYGFIRVLCSNLAEFRIYKDPAITMSYDSGDLSGGAAFVRNFARMGGGGSGSPIKNLSQFKIYSYGFLYKNLQLLDLFLTYLNSKRHQILQNFTIECLEKCKPVVDSLYNELN